MDLTEVLNGPLATRHPPDRPGEGRGQDTRTVTIRPIAFGQAQSLLYEKWVKDNRKAVEAASHGTLGYLHIKGMNLESFYKFEEELYSAGAGKDGLIIDVRENGGGSTTDHLLTVLTQPVHAITVPRGGGPGYPHDRRVYATWSKPIVVLCNQNSFSNAEIFAHAIQTLHRGKLVGVPTAGGVISTGSTSILDVGTPPPPPPGLVPPRHRRRHGAQRRRPRAHRLARARRLRPRHRRPARQGGRRAAGGRQGGEGQAPAQTPQGE